MSYFRRSIIFSRCYRWCDLYRDGKVRSYWGIYVNTAHLDTGGRVLEDTAIQKWEI